MSGKVHRIPLAMTVLGTAQGHAMPVQMDYNESHSIYIYISLYFSLDGL